MVRNELALWLQNPFYKIVSDIINSPTNPAVKELVKLRESPRRRRERQCFVVEGAQDLQALIDAGRQVLEIYFNENLVTHSHATTYFLKWREKHSFSMRELGKEALLKASYRKTSDGVIGVVQAWEMDILGYEVEPMDGPVLIFDEIEKPGNLGAILRTSEALGGGLVLLSDPKVDFFNPNVIRSSRGLMGKSEVKSGSKSEIYNWLKKQGLPCVATSSKASDFSHTFLYERKMALLFGNEHQGLGEYWKQKVDRWVSLKMFGCASSLNLNVSVGCILSDYNRSVGRI